MSVIHAHTPSYPISAVPVSRPLIWLARGWQDLMHHRAASLAYGAMISFMGLIVFAYQRHPLAIATAVSLFMLVGPIMAAGICELSRSSDANETSDFASSLQALGKNRENLIHLVLALLGFSVLWFAATYAVIEIALGTAMPAINDAVWGDVARLLSSEQIVAYSLSLGILAFIVLAVSVVTVPMIIEHHVDALSAINTSLRVTLKDFPAIVVWAVLLAALIAIGFASYLILMVVIFPLLGHATWYAYRDLVKQ